jgi:hypothetical protein
MPGEYKACAAGAISGFRFISKPAICHLDFYRKGGSFLTWHDSGVSSG